VEERKKAEERGRELLEVESKRAGVAQEKYQFELVAHADDVKVLGGMKERVAELKRAVEERGSEVALEKKGREEER